MNDAALLLDEILAPIAAEMADPATEDICLDRPHEAFILRRGQWDRREIPEFDFETLEAIAILAGALRGQDCDRTKPLCGGELHTGHRFQAVLPPAVLPGTASLTFRRPSDFVAPVAGLAARYDTEGWNRWAEGRRSRHRAELLAAFDAGDIEAFARGIVAARCNVLMCGATGSGKTFISKTLVSEVNPRERILTIEDAAELVVPQPNHVRLLYSKDGSGPGPDHLMEASLRMRPDRVMLQELRDDAAWTYLNEVMTGHPGSMTTIHGEDARSAFMRLFSLVKGSPRGRSLEDGTVASMLAAAVDVIIPLHNDAGRFSIGAVWFADDAARRGERVADLLEVV